MEKPGIPVAQYLRMSTEKQEYSLDNQSAAIARYAEAHRFQVVRTYTDAGKSGIVLRHREGLRMLLNDVVNPNVDFKAILVYDVSRWGRFQDVDEAAHYEFLCKSAGVPVIYCAETFTNDGTMPSSIMKALKRVMAGEYSRELGVKVYAGLKRLADMGFKQGGEAGFGLRRMLVNGQREPKQLLERGEYKSIVNDRVILVPGPAHEVATVRDIYRMFLEDGLTMTAIARELNRRRIGHVADGPWTIAAISTILTHPKYTGFNVFGRTSYKLHNVLLHLPRAQWHLTAAYEPIIDHSSYLKVQQRFFQQTHHKSDEQLLEDLRSLLAATGRLSLDIIDADPNMASPATYRTRFGSLSRAYELIGYGQPQDFVSAIDVRRRTDALRAGLLRSLEAMFPNKIHIVRPSPRRRARIRVAGGTTVALLMCRWVSVFRGRPFAKWEVKPHRSERRFVTLVARLNDKNDGFYDLHLLQRLEHKSRFYPTLDHPWLANAKRLRHLSEFCDTIRLLKHEPRNS